MDACWAIPLIVPCANVRSTITSTHRSRLWAMSLSVSRASSLLLDWSTNIVVPPRLAIPASKVKRVLSDGFSKNITICFPASARANTDGRDFISSARCSTASTPCGPRSRGETKSGSYVRPTCPSLLACPLRAGTSLARRSGRKTKDDARRLPDVAQRPRHVSVYQPHSATGPTARH